MGAAKIVSTSNFRATIYLWSNCTRRFPVGESSDIVVPAVCPAIIIITITLTTDGGTALSRYFSLISMTFEVPLVKLKIVIA